MKSTYQSLPTMISLEQVDSTNEYLLRRLKDEVREDTLVWTFNQTRGKGVSGRWIAKKGEALSFSFSLHGLRLAAQKSFILNALVSNYLSTQISKLISLPVQVKWPNDIYVCSRKISGILIESKISNGQIIDVIIGIGININQSTFPKSISQKATSMFLETGKEKT